MADYNVQMKQYNGTSFDNILPYASQALTLAGGGGATEIIAQARAGLSQIATGSYVGTGTTSFNIIVGFSPKIVLVQSDTISLHGGATASGIERNLSARNLNTYFSIFWISGLSDSMIFREYENREYYGIYQKCVVNGNNINISLYASDSRFPGELNPKYICNNSGEKYIWIAFG